MKDYVVLFKDASLLPADAPLGFICHADDTLHAEEQTTNAYPDCEIVWVVEGVNNLEAAYEDYYSNCN